MILTAAAKWRHRLVLASGLTLLMGSHAYVILQGERYVGPVLISDHVFDLWLVLLLLALCGAVGLRSLERFRFTFDSPIERLLFSVAIGSGCVAVSILILGFLSALRPLLIALLIVSWLFWARREITQIWLITIEAAKEIKRQNNVVSLTIMAVVVAFMVFQALLPSRDWDSLMYQLRVPEQFATAGRIFLPEDNLHAAYVQFVQMLYIPLLAYGSTAGPALLNVAFAVFLGLAVFSFAQRFFGCLTAVFSMQLLWSSTVLLVVAITPRIDVTFALFLFLAHFGLLLATIEWKCFYLAAALLGYAVGIKYTGIVYALALVPVILWVSWSRRASVISAVVDLGRFSAISLAVSVPWFAKNWWLFRAPFYPFFAQRKIDPWLGFLYPEKALPASIDPNIVSILGQVRLPFNLVDVFINPSVLSVEMEAVFYRFSPIFLILIAWVISINRSAILNGLIIPSIGYLVALILFSSRTNLRYLIPVIAPLTVASVYLLVSRTVGPYRSRTALIFAHLLVLAALFPTATMMTTWTANKLAFDYVTGRASRDDFLYHTKAPADYAELAPTLAYINQNLPPTSRILMLFEARGYYFHVPVIQDNVLTNWPLMAARASNLDCLAGSGITHVLVNVGGMNYYLQRGLNPSTLRWDLFKKFADQCLISVFQGPTHVLYGVRKSSLHGERRTSQ
jgi:hypothetical protein